MHKNGKSARKIKIPFPLRQLLKKHGCSQRQLAKRCGMGEQRVSNLANGRHSPTWNTILRICTAIGADLGDLQPGPEAQRPRRRRAKRTVSAQAEGGAA